MALTSFHPAVAGWFSSAVGVPTEPQARAWPRIAAGEHALIAAPTGSGKTLAAFLAAIDQLVREGLGAGGLPDGARILYVSPLRALSHDVEKNLQAPLSGIAEQLRASGLTPPAIRTWVRTGDTSASARAAARKSPPHIVVTTPESLYVLLTSESGRALLASVRTVIVDEIHALVRDKRGSHLALSLERLELLVQARGTRLQRIGLSATQRPIDEIASFLIGVRSAPCPVIDVGQQRPVDLALLLPDAPLEAVMSHETWDELYAKLVLLIASHRTTIVFVNTRRCAERVARRLSEQLGEENVAAHHGSLARERRLASEQQLKRGQLKVLVATASLELGIDVGEIDLVCQLGSPRSISSFVQRVGRSGHRLDRIPKGRLVPLSRDDLVECVALLAAVRAGELDRARIPVAPLDVLAQQIVAEVSAEARSVDELFQAFTRALPYASLGERDFRAIVGMLADGYSTRRGRRAALIHHDAVHERLRGRRSARLVALTSGGAIPDTFDYDVVLEPDNVLLGTVHEDFAIESMAGEVFQLGNASYRIRKADPGVLRVEDARGQSPSMPFWIAEAPGRSDELSMAVSRLRSEVEAWLDEPGGDARARAEAQYGIDSPEADQLIEYLTTARAALGALPTQRRIVVERFFDDTDSMHVVLHAPFGTRINRAFGFALRKRFCRSFNVELQAAATDDAILLSLGPMHSFPLDDLFRFVRAHGVRDVLVQALLVAPVFAVRFRWNASRALAISRQRGGKRVPARFQRMAADDLLALVFPDQVACAEHLTGDREVPDHPLVNQTIDDCLHEAMDLPGLERVLQAIEAGELACVAVDLREPSALAHEILNARPYAFLDDAPLEERRTQAVSQRRRLDPEAARTLAQLDPQAIAAVVDSRRPEARDADELHDVLLTLGGLPAAEGVSLGFGSLFDQLCTARRAALLTKHPVPIWVAAERLALWQSVCPSGRLEPAIVPPAALATELSREDALRELVRGRLEITGPVSASELAASLGLAEGDVQLALALLEAEGFVLRGQFRTPCQEVEWCERRLLARIHRATLEQLRREIEPVSPAVLMRFWTEHQGLAAETRRQGPEGLYAAVEQLAGFELSACAWERDVLPARVQGDIPALLDQLSFTGRVAWARAGSSAPRRVEGPIRTTPIALFPREQLHELCEAAGEAATLSLTATKVLARLEASGASFVSDLTRSLSLQRSEVEDALGELAAQGLVTSDGFAGLRALLSEGPSARARSGGEAGRYARLERREGPCDPELVARALLTRWGIVFRKLLDRESLRVPWLPLLRALRRLEDRGEVRGGRFVTGFSGEQFVLPEVVAALRRVRRSAPRGELLSISACDPLNLVGIVTPGPHVARVPSNRLLLRDGVPVAVLSAQRFQPLVDAAESELASFQRTLGQVPKATRFESRRELELLPP